LGLANLCGVFADEDEGRVEAEDARRPGGILAGEGDVNGSGRSATGAAPLRLRATSLAKYSGAVAMLSVRRWTNSFLLVAIRA
jgi:hypothetical protein